MICAMYKYILGLSAQVLGALIGNSGGSACSRTMGKVMRVLVSILLTLILTRTL